VSEGVAARDSRTAADPASASSARTAAHSRKGLEAMLTWGVMIIAGLRKLIVVALLSPLTASALAATPARHAVDRRLCPFPLGITVRAHEIGLRDVATGKTAVVRRSPRRIRLAPENDVPYLSTKAGGADPRVVDPCALVAPAAPPTNPRSTRAPW